MSDLETLRAEIAGVPAFVVPDGPRVPVVGLTFRVGRADETAATSGLSHLVEHLALPATTATPFDFNGTVDTLFTSLFASGDLHDLRDFVATTSGLLRNLPEERFETERRILVAEESTRSSGGARQALALRFGPVGHGLPGYFEYGLRRAEWPEVAGWASERFTTASAAFWLSGATIDDLGLESRAPRRRQPRGASTPTRARRPLDTGRLRRGLRRRGLSLAPRRPARSDTHRARHVRRRAPRAASLRARALVLDRARSPRVDRGCIAPLRHRRRRGRAHRHLARGGDDDPRAARRRRTERRGARADEGPLPALRPRRAGSHGLGGDVRGVGARRAPGPDPRRPCGRVRRRDHRGRRASTRRHACVAPRSRPRRDTGADGLRGVSRLLVGSSRRAAAPPRKPARPHAATSPRRGALLVAGRCRERERGRLGDGALRENGALHQRRGSAHPAHRRRLLPSDLRRARGRTEPSSSTRSIVRFRRISSSPTGPPPTLERRRYSELARSTFRRTWLVSEELELLPALLEEGEEPLVLAKASRGWKLGLLALTDRRLHFVYEDGSKHSFVVDRESVERDRERIDPDAGSR